MSADDAAAREQALQRLLVSVHDQPWAHDFFALLRRVDALRPAQPRTGEALRPRQEALRLAQPPELNFAPAALERLQLRDNAPARLSVRFFGLFGPHGPMPLHFTEHVRERVHQHGDTAAAHFLDLFHHRMLSLFYRAWAQAQPVVQADRPQDDRFIAWLGAVAGLPATADALPPQALAFQAGLLSSRSRHPEGMVKVLRQYFDVPVGLRTNVGEWLAISPEDRSRLGHAGNRPERSRFPAAQLGRAANAGSRVWDRQYRFRLRLGPLSLVQYEAFLPTGVAWPPLQAWVGLLASAELRWELELALRADQRPAPRLGRQVRLGVTCWLQPRSAAPPTAGREPRALRIRPGLSFLQRHAQPA